MFLALSNGRIFNKKIQNQVIVWLVMFKFSVEYATKHTQWLVVKSIFAETLFFVYATLILSFSRNEINYEMSRTWFASECTLFWKEFYEGRQWLLAFLGAPKTSILCFSYFSCGRKQFIHLEYREISNSSRRLQIVGNFWHRRHFEKSQWVRKRLYTRSRTLLSWLGTLWMQ